MQDFHKKACVLFISASLAFGLAACGRKPSLADLKQPEPKSESVLSDAQNAETLDGNQDGLESVSQAKPQRKFFLDFLL